MLATGFVDGRVTLEPWDRQTARPTARGAEELHYRPRLEWDARTLASGSTDGKIVLWDIKSRQQIGEPLHGYGTVWSLAFSPTVARSSPAETTPHTSETIVVGIGLRPAAQPTMSGRWTESDARRVATVRILHALSENLPPVAHPRRQVTSPGASAVAWLDATKEAERRGELLSAVDVAEQGLAEHPEELPLNTGRCLHWRVPARPRRRPTRSNGTAWQVERRGHRGAWRAHRQGHCPWRVG